MADVNPGSQISIPKSNHCCAGSAGISPNFLCPAVLVNGQTESFSALKNDSPRPSTFSNNCLCGSLTPRLGRLGCPSCLLIIFKRRSFNLRLNCFQAASAQTRPETFPQMLSGLIADLDRTAPTAFEPYFTGELILAALALV